MKIAYISHYGRPNYEFNWFSLMPAEVVKFIDVDFSDYPKQQPNNVEYCKVDYRERKISKGRFHSSASLINYTGFEKHLQDVDIIVVLEVFSSLSKQFVQYAKRNGKKSVVLVYELIARHPLNYLPTHILNRRYTIKYADQFICVSDKARHSLERLGANKAKCFTVYPGINMELFDQKLLKAPVNRPPGIIYVGGLKTHKGIDILLSLADHLLAKYPKARITVAGAGPYAKTLEEYSQKYPGFMYVGKIPNRQLPELLRKNEIYVLPCRDVYKYGLMITSEQFGFSFVEAMACGLAVVTTDAGAIPEIVGNHNFICEQGSADSVIAAVEQLYARPSKLAKVRQENKRLSRAKYDIHTQAKELYERLVA